MVVDRCPLGIGGSVARPAQLNLYRERILRGPPMTQHARDLWDNPMATDGFEFVEYTAQDVGELHALFKRMGFRVSRRGEAPVEERHPVPAGQHQLCRQCRARQPRHALCPGARSVGLRHGVSGEGCGVRLSTRAGAGREAVPERRRTDGTEYPGHRRHRRQRDLSGRPLRRAPRSTTSIFFPPMPNSAGSTRDRA